MLGSITSKILRHNAKVGADRGLRFHNFAFKRVISSCKSRPLPNMTPARPSLGPSTWVMSTGYPLLMGVGVLVVAIYCQTSTITSSPMPLVRSRSVLFQAFSLVL